MVDLPDLVYISRICFDIHRSCRFRQCSTDCRRSESGCLYSTCIWLPADFLRLWQLEMETRKRIRTAAHKIKNKAAIPFYPVMPVYSVFHYILPLFCSCKEETPVRYKQIIYRERMFVNEKFRTNVRKICLHSGREYGMIKKTNSRRLQLPWIKGLSIRNRGRSSPI